MLRHRLLLPFSLLVLVLNLAAETGHSQPPAKDLHGDPLPEGAIARAGQDRWLHGIRATFAAFLPDGKQVLTVCSDMTTRIWDFPSGKEISRAPLTGSDPAALAANGFGGPFGGTNNNVALTRDGKTLAQALTFLAAKDGPNVEVFFQDVATGKELPQGITMAEAKDAPKGKGRFRVDGMAFSPNGEQLVTLTNRGKVTLWHWAKNKELWSGEIGVQQKGFADQRVVFAPDGKSIVTGQMMFEPMQNDIVEIKLWDAATGKLLWKMRIETESDDGSPLALAFSPDSKTLAFTSGPTITLADTAKGKEIGKLSAGKGTEKEGGGVPYLEMASVAFGKDGTKVYATAYGNRGVMEWDVASRKLVREGPRPGGEIQPFAISGDLSLSPDGNTAVVTGPGPQFFDLTGGKDITAINRPTNPLTAVRFLPDGKTVVTGSGVSGLPGFVAAVGPAAMRKWDAATGKDLGAVVLPPGNGIGGLSPDGKVVAGLQLAAPFGDGKVNQARVILADAATGKPISQVALKEPESTVGVCFAPDGKSIAIGQPKKQKLELYDVATAKLLRTFDVVPAAGKGGFAGRLAAQQSMLFAPDGKTLAWFDAQSMTAVVLLDSATGKKVGVLPLPANLVPMKGKGGFGGPALYSVMERAAFSPDGRCLAVELLDGTTALFELASGQQRGTFGKKLAEPKDAPKDGPKGFLVLAAGKGRTCFAFSPDGRSAAQSGTDGVISLWDVVSGKEMKQFKGHADVVNALAFAPDGRTLASASADSTALLWDVSKLARPALVGTALKPADLEACWEALAGNDAEAAFAKMRDLVAAPKDAVAFLKERLKPAPPVDLKRAQELMDLLDDPQFKVRDKAAKELERFGEQIVPVLDKALADNVPLEPRQRIEVIRGKLTGLVLQGDRLRAYRAVEVLELIGTKEARQVLQALANGAPAALLTTSAQAALKR
jgi:WD40 repeat protein